MHTPDASDPTGACPASTLRAALLACVCGLVAACGPSEDADAPTFPVRLLPPAPPLGFASLIEPTFGAPDALAPWSVLEVDADGAPTAVVPAAGHPRVEVDGDALVLQPGTGVLFREVEVPADLLALVRLRLTASSGSSEGHCPLARGPQLAVLGDGPPPAPLAELRAGAPHDHESRKLYHRHATRILNFSDPVTGFSWGDPVPDGRPRVAEARFRTRESPELRAICIRSPDDVLRIEEVALGQAPALRRNDQRGVLPPPSTGDELRPRQAPFAGELRPAVRVDGGAHVTLAAELPGDAARLDLGVVAPPSPEPAAGDAGELRWRVELVGARGSFDGPWVAERSLRVRPGPPSDGVDGSRDVDLLELGSGTARTTDRPVRWRDVSLAWPPGRPAGPVELRVSVEGTGALLLGQPVVHGPARASLPDEDAADEDPRRNLLLVSIDTLRADHTGWHGYERPTTPRLDGFAAGATVFERCTSVGPYTLPSHATLLSGLFPMRHGARETTDRVGEGVPTLATMLAARGWSTAAFTGGGFLSPDYGFSDGFDRYQSVDPVHDPELTGGRGRYSAENVPHREELDALHSLDAVGDWVERVARGPWFAFVHTYVAHEYRPPAADLALFDRAPGSDWGTDVQSRLTPRAWVEDPPTPADVEHLVDLYDASIHFVDREIGALLDRLERAGLLEDTLVVLTSDHGEEFLEHGHLRHSQSLYEEMLHVPLVIRLPGQKTGARVPTPVHLVDVAPTVLSVLGLPVPPGLDGVSRHDLLPGAGDAAPPPPTPLYASVETDWSRRSSLRLGDVKLIRGDTSPELTYPASATWELYDLDADPDETENLYDERTREAALLRHRLEAFEASQREQALESGRAEVSEELRDQLKALGYVDEG